VFTKDGRRAWPSLPTLPGTDGTIGRQGPGVRTGRLGTLVVIPLAIAKRFAAPFVDHHTPILVLLFAIGEVLNC